MTDELTNPPFDPTPVEIAEYPAKYTILARAYPETGQTFDEAAFQPEPPCARGLKEWWREVFGPSKSDLREEVHIKGVEILSLLEQKAELLSKNIALCKQIEVFRKQVAIREKTYTTVSELAQQRIQDIATLRHSLNAANEEIERLAMAPQLIAPRKGQRKKKGK